MSLLIYFKLDNEKAQNIKQYEDALNIDFDFKNEFKEFKTYGLLDSATYKDLPGEFKTYLSIKYNPSTIYDITLCSAKIVWRILQITGVVYAPCFTISPDFSDYTDILLDINVVYKKEII